MSGPQALKSLSVVRATVLALISIHLASCGSERPAPAQYQPVTVPTAASPELQAAIEQLNSANPLSRAFGAALLGDMPQQADAVVPLLLQSLQDGNHLVRSRAAEALGRLEADAAIDPLIAILKQPQEDRDVRASAAEALGRLRATAAVDTLIGALDDIAWSVRYQAVVALGRIGNPAAESALTEAARYDPDFPVREAAQEALQQLPDLGEDQQTESVRRDGG
jgi:HEAT repeat protein